MHNQPKRNRWLLIALFTLFACAGATVDTARAERPAATPAQPPLFDNLGNLHRQVTAKPMAQRYFDQGWRLTWGFNHPEALAAFRQGAALDPACAMCWWGIAFVLGPNLNLPMNPDDEPEAVAAVRRAQTLAQRTSPFEQALIGALSGRYGAETEDKTARAGRDRAWATGMEQVAARYPDDPDVLALYADALMNLRPWAYWTGEGQPEPGTRRQLAALEHGLSLAPDHPGLCHLYIHTVEASPHPKKGLPCAERLPGLMPGSGHLVHMPAHIYMRLGMYDRAVENNVHATAADDRYMASQAPTGFYRQLYIPHNTHFLWAAATMAGQREKALTAARELADRIPYDMVRKEWSVEFFTPTPYYAMARFEAWDELLAELAPPDDFAFTTGMWHYARGLALTATGHTHAARGELSALENKRNATDPDRIVSLNSARNLLSLAHAVLAARIAEADGDVQTALNLLDTALALETALTDDEPAPWYHPVRQIIGELLLDAGRYTEAAAAFTGDLKKNPENGWSLSGLAHALSAQGDPRATGVKERLKKAWKEADLPQMASRR